MHLLSLSTYCTFMDKKLSISKVRLHTKFKDSEKPHETVLSEVAHQVVYSLIET